MMLNDEIKNGILSKVEEIQMGDIDNVIDNKPVICVFCETEIGNSEDKCNMCSATKEHRKEYQDNLDSEQSRKLNNKNDENKNEYKICDNQNVTTNADNVDKSKYGMESFIKKRSNDLINKEYSEKIFKDDEVESVTNVELQVKDLVENIDGEYDNNNLKIENKGNNEECNLLNNENDRNNCKIMKKNIRIDQWKCGGCGYLNEYTFINCKVCEGLYKDGKWNCGKCKMENSCVNNKCNECGENNVNIKKERRENNDAKDLINNENDINEFKINNKKIEENKFRDKWKCGRCECMNEYTFINCKACEGLYKDGKWNCEKCTFENSCNNNKCGACKKKNKNIKTKEIRKDIDLLANDKGYRLKNIRDGKWKCGGCNYLNEYTLKNCLTCGLLYKDGKWNCEKCSFENSCVNDKCGTCNKKNIHIKTDKNTNDIDLLVGEKDKGLKKNKKVNLIVKNNDMEMKVCIKDNKWKCGRCECMNEYTFINCITCEGLYKDGKWNCGKCAFENSCNNDKCGACGEKNINIKTEENRKDIDLLANEKGYRLKNIRDGKWKCAGCGYLNEYTLKNCLACGLLYKDGKWNCEKCSFENSCVNDKCGTCEEKNTYAKTEENENEINLLAVEKDHKVKSGKVINLYKEIDKEITNNKWKCGRCECMNEYTFINCKACEGLYKDGKWKCEKCTMENSCINDKCGACEEKNINIKTEINIDCINSSNYDKCETLINEGIRDIDEYDAIKKEIEVKIGHSQWKCERCKIMNLYSAPVCGGCNGSIMMTGLWQCTQCSLVNKCKIVECTVCGVKNDNMLIKYCKYCRKIKLKINEVRCSKCALKNINTWRCLFSHCKELNVENDDYCQKCRIHCYSSQSRGMPVKVYNQERYIWICIKCHKYNELNCLVCQCGENKEGLFKRILGFFKN